jgi:hypothetical protein
MFPSREAYGIEIVVFVPLQLAMMFAPGIRA